MRIGVITYSRSKDNYGQILQCYALQEVLKQKGHSPFLIRYRTDTKLTKPGFKIKNLWKYVSRFQHYITWYKNKKQANENEVNYQNSVDVEKRNFEGFIKNRIDATPFYNSQTIHDNPPTADAYICGSDQIWGSDDAYYLSFAPDDALKIAYAPSFGGLKDFSEERAENMKRLISRLNKVSMREQSGVETCQKLGFENVIQVLDPTLLLKAEDYRKIAKEPCEKEFGFTYLLGSPIDVSIEEIDNFIKNRELKHIYVASQGRYDEFEKIDATIEEWLGYIDNASLVITNSFHCAVFALIFHKPLIVIPLSGSWSRMNTRVSELLEKSNLSQLLTSNLKDVKLDELNFTKFENYIETERINSLNFLDI